MTFTLPEPKDVIDLTMTDGAVYRIRRHGKEGATRLFISHGNGFAADAYFPFWGPLADDYELFVFDIRNHGWNGRTPANGHRYQQIAEDLETIHRGIDDALGKGKCVGVFHSMSARAAMKRAVESGWHWDALALFDPPNMPLLGHWFYDDMRKFELRLIDYALNRPKEFDSVEELAKGLAASPVSTRWVDGATDLMAAALLKQNAETGKWELSCRREFEASIYLEALTMDLWPQGKEFGGPTILIGADPDLKGPPTGKVNQIIAEENGIAYTAIPDTDHLLQIEQPAACRDALLAFLNENGLGA